MVEKLYTVGHSNFDVDAFIGLLQQHQITALADVRSHPYSRHLPHFSQAPLKAILEKAGIRYVFLGRELGARPKDPNCYVDGKALYARIAATEAFQEGVQRVLLGVKKFAIALMCAEKDPLTCHRAILVCQHLRHFDLEINHILKDGELESHTQLEDRLLKLHGLAAPDTELTQLSLFELDAAPVPTSAWSREAALKDAYRIQSDKIAYIEKTQEQHESAD